MYDFRATLEESSSPIHKHPPHKRAMQWEISRFYQAADDNQKNWSI
jgi:hypothetical protein